MNSSSAIAAFFCALLPIAVLALVVRRDRRSTPERKMVALLSALGALAAAGSGAAQRAAEGWTGLSMEASPGAYAGALAYGFLFVAPLEELAKGAVVWAAIRRIDAPTRYQGILYAMAVAAGFAAIDGAAAVSFVEPTALRILRAVLSQPMQFFCAALVGYSLSHGREGRAGFALLVAIGVHGLYDHIVFGRGPGMLALVVPMLATMGVLAWALLRDVSPDSLPRGRSRLPEPPSLRAMRQALRRTEQPLMLHWIAIGALVNVGVVLASVALAVYAGHRFGVDFAAADEADMRANGPIFLLGAAVLAAFPVAGYLVARASGSSSVLEPAMATGLALASVVALLSVTAPVAVIFVLAVAPVAFGLACAGAWMGLGRRR